MQKNRKKTWCFWVLSLLVIIQNSIQNSYAIQNFNRSYFYRASSLWPEPRFEQPYLSTFTFSFSGGHTHCGSNNCGDTVPIVTLTQPEQPAHFNKCSHIKDRQYRQARWIYQGNFEFNELNINAYQSIGCNTFLHLHVPVIQTKYSPGIIIPYPLQRSENVYQKHMHSFCATKSNWGTADTTLFAGFTRNSYNTCYVDFIDYSLQAGILFPTSSACCDYKKFRIPFGYNGRWGATAMINIATGLYDWLTLGLHADATLLTSKTYKTCRDRVHYHRASLFLPSVPVTRIGGFIKADHIFYGFSCAFGLSHETFGSSACNHLTELPKRHIFCEQIDGWSRSIVHIILELDLGAINCLVPEFAFSYHHQFNGRNVFNTNVLEGTLSLNLRWLF